MSVVVLGVESQVGHARTAKDGGNRPDREGEVIDDLDVGVEHEPGCWGGEVAVVVLLAHADIVSDYGVHTNPRGTEEEEAE